MREYILRTKLPAAKWEDCTPVGNGRMGISALCGVAQEKLYLNEETVWSTQGEAKPNPAMKEKLALIRQMFLERREAEADRLAKTYLADCFTRIRSYESAGILTVDLHGSDSCRNYARRLDLMRGVAQVSYDKDGSHYVREFFASAPDDVMVFRVTSSKAPLSARIGYEREKCLGVSAEDNTLTAVAKTVFGDYRFCVKARVVTDGKVVCENGELVVSDTRSFTLLVSIATQFRYGAAFESAVTFPEADYETLKQRHMADFLSFMDRADIELPQTPEVEDLSMQERRVIYAHNKPNDNGLIMLQWQFGRYLLVSSSRPRCLPANLQGLWNYDLGPAWSCDYHTNINLQCNYWAAETVGLSDCHTALLDYMNKYLLESGKRTAAEGYGTRGGVVHHLRDIYGFTTPADGLWGIWPHGARWLSYHMWEHYLFTQDRDFLEKEGYEFIRQAAIFFLENLVEDDQGYLVYGPSTSPENRYFINDENGQPYACYLTLSSTMDVGIIGGLFRNFLDASAVLGIEDEDVAAIRAAKAKMPPFKISSRGHIQEWIEDYEETEKGHFHLSPCFAMYPDCAINRGTPELQEAMERTIDGRLYGGVNAGGHGAINVGWSMGWLMGLLSRLRRGNDSFEIAKSYVMNIANRNSLLDIHAVCFQIDGNMAFVSGVCEMLIQSHEGVIALLPALPQVWDKGSFRGLHARGGFTLDIRWENCEVREFTVVSNAGLPARVELPATQKLLTFRDDAGNTYTAEQGVLTLPAGKLHLTAV